MTRAKISKAPRASDEERKERRRAANRRSAQKSRYREMVLMDELQKTVSELTKRNAMLREENEAFRRDVAVLKGVVQQRELRQEVEKTSIPLCHSPLTALDDANINTGALNMIPRTGSPFEIQSLLNPEKVFPFDGGYQNDTTAPTVLSAENLFQAVMASSAGGL